MRFNPKARLDRSRIRDVGRGGGGGGFGGPGMRLPIPGGGIGGGIGGVILLILLFVLAQCAGLDLLGGGTSSSASGYSASRMGDSQDTGRYDHCETGEDANNDPDCARVAIENSLNDFWGDQGIKGWRTENELITFTGSIQTGCGPADSAVGPFYCPADENIYFDTSFYDDVLERQLGGPDGGFVEAYVIAHEYGHHIQNILGTMGRVTSQETGPNSPSVRLELQADCYAGMWTKFATTTKDASGQVLILDLTQQDIDLALEAAASVGDDRIQQKTQGQVDAETWTHGSAASRQYWFTQGYTLGTLDACDTFSVRNVEVS
ncbi:MAG TPA: neutral zinc metallopeptidase [Nocardioides sp.]|nr:neutral zinc metallopeptidase [Nocardioides sp.]